MLQSLPCRIITNLHFNVSQEDITELFATVGVVEKAGISFDPR